MPGNREMRRNRKQKLVKAVYVVLKVLNCKIKKDGLNVSSMPLATYFFLRIVTLLTCYIDLVIWLKSFMYVYSNKLFLKS